MLGVIIDVLYVGVLDHVPSVHYENFVASFKRYAQIVRDKDESHRVRVLNIF
jgi:hypothetical protein